MLDLTVYLVTDSTGIDESIFLEKIELACQGGVTLLQIREKEKTSRDFYHLAQKVKLISDRYNIPLLINDRVDIAAAVDAAGVHVGQSDLPVACTRAILGSDKIVGATAKTVEQAQQAAKEGANYLGVGAIYPTTTKVKTVLTPVRTLDDICRSVSIPVVAIGGLNANNCDILKGIPIAGISVVSAIMKAADPRSATEELREKSLELLSTRH
ncbi:thiamine phosphate synthase [Clostridium merdae]|uniref:thiamine phosphate synthase n=1 Tax=Clostridium merdae TaxID=1958780 RepID=UPI000A26A242|nr:thiamine phosphate synthase [Clostridium merdae]